MKKRKKQNAASSSTGCQGGESYISWPNSYYVIKKKALVGESIRKTRQVVMGVTPVEHSYTPQI